MRLQREAPDPLYLQLKESLVEEINSGRYRPHRRLPSERELAERFKVSRMTARQALLGLAHDGLVYTRAGKGTFVAEPKIEQQLRSLTGFTQDVSDRGGKPSSRVLEASVVAATPEVASMLGLAPGAEVVLLSRVRLSDGTPLAIETAHLPLALVPALLQHDFTVESLYKVLEDEYGLALTQAEQTIEAALADPQEIELLEMIPPAAVLRIRRLSRTAGDVAVEYVRSAYRGDRYKFHSTLQSTSASGLPASGAHH